MLSAGGVQGGSGVGGLGRGKGEGVEGGRGRGHCIHLAIHCTITSIVLRPKGTSHNNNNWKSIYTNEKTLLVSAFRHL